jgi:hypothetical protein
MASRFIGRAAPVARFLATNAPTALKYAGQAADVAGRVATNPLVAQLANRAGVNPNTLGAMQRGIHSVGAGINLAPQVMRDVGAAARQGGQAANAAKASLAQLYRTAHG